MRKFVHHQQECREHGDFLQRKVDVARASVHERRGRSIEAVEADFVARRAQITDRA